MLYKKKVVEMEEYKNGKLKLVDGAPQVILTTATLTPAVRRSLDKPESPFEPKKMYGKQNDAEKKDNNDDDDNDDELTSNAMKIALPRDIRMLTSCRARGRW